MNTIAAFAFVIFVSMAIQRGESCDPDPICCRLPPHPHFGYDGCCGGCRDREEHAGLFDRSLTINTEAIKKLFKDLDLNMDDQITIKDLANMVVDLGIDEERDDHIEDQIRSVDNGDNQIDLEEFTMLIDRYASLIFDNDMDEKVRAVLQA